MKTLVASSFLLVAAAWANTATASSFNVDKPSVDKSAITKVATYVCVRDDRGWHYMRGERRITCRPAHPGGKEWGWRCEGKRCGWWHRGEKRWHD
jgi:hypothetical protein